MRTISYSQFRSQLAGEIERVNENHVPVIITRKNGQPAVLMSLEDFKAYEETAYLMASPKNAERLSRSINNVRIKNVEEHGLIEK